MKLKFNVELTPYQKQMKDGVDWLIINTARAQGKTMVMCMSFIERAYIELDHPIRIFDHNNTNYGNRHRHVYAMICSLFNGIKDNDRYRLEINDRDRSIKVRHATYKEIKERKKIEEK